MRISTHPESLLERAGLLARQVPTPMVESYIALMQARAVMAGTSLGVFDALAPEPACARTLAERLGVREDGLDVLLPALETAGLVERDGDGYRNSAVAARWLVRDTRRSLHHWVGSFTYGLWDYLDRFEDVARGGEPVGLHERSPDDPFWERYAGALLESSRLVGAAFARAVPAESPQRLLDLAGGPGGYAMAMCERHPGLRATVVELEPQARRGREVVAEHAMADRVEFRAGDLFEIELGCGYDVALANNVLHTLEPERCVALLRRAREALREDGTLAVLELERPPDGRRGSGFGTLLALVFYAAARTRTYTAGEISGWFEEAGLRRIRVKRPIRLAGSVVVTGVR